MVIKVIQIKIQMKTDQLIINYIGLHNYSIMYMYIMYICTCTLCTYVYVHYVHMYMFNNIQ